MTQQEVHSELEEIVDIAKIAFSTFYILEYLNQTIFDLEGDIITDNTFLRTSIFTNWRICVLELTKLFPATARDDNNDFAIRKFINKLETQTKLFTKEEIKSLREHQTLAYEEETQLGNKIVNSILVQRDTAIAHTDRGRLIMPYGVSLADLMFLCRRAEIIIDIIHRKVHGTPLNIVVFEPRDGLRSLVDEIAGARRVKIREERIRRLTGK